MTDLGHEFEEVATLLSTPDFQSMLDTLESFVARLYRKGKGIRDTAAPRARASILKKLLGPLREKGLVDDAAAFEDYLIP